MQVKNVSGKASTLRGKCTVGPSGRCKLHVQANLKKKNVFKVLFICDSKILK